MTTIADDLAKGRPLPILTRENYQRWFELSEMHFEAEGIFHTISDPQLNLNLTALLQQQMNKLSIDRNRKEKTSTPLTPGTPIVESESWKKDNAKACYLITICLGQFDQERVRAIKTAAEKCTSLFKKYSNILPTSGRQYLQELVSYKMEQNTTIQEAWGELLLLRDKVIMATPKLRDAFSTQQLFQLLYNRSRLNTPSSKTELTRLEG